MNELEKTSTTHRHCVEGNSYGLKEYNLTNMEHEALEIAESESTRDFGDGREESGRNLRPSPTQSCHGLLKPSGEDHDVPIIELTPLYDNEPPFPPGFEPQLCMDSEDMDVETRPMQKKEYSPLVRPGQSSEETNPNTNILNRRITRSSTKAMESPEMRTKKKVEAIETWDLGKKLGLYAEDDEVVIEALLMEDAITDAVKLRKRGRPRKRKIEL